MVVASIIETITDKMTFISDNYFNRIRLYKFTYTTYTAIIA